MKTCNFVYIAVVCVLVACHGLDYLLCYFAPYLGPEVLLFGLPTLGLIQLVLAPVVPAMMVWSLVRSQVRWRNLCISGGVMSCLGLSYLLPFSVLNVPCVGLKDRIGRVGAEPDLRAFALEMRQWSSSPKREPANKYDVLLKLRAKYAFLNWGGEMPLVWMSPDRVKIVWGSSKIGYGVDVGFDGKRIANDSSDCFFISRLTGDIYCEPMTD